MHLWDVIGRVVNGDIVAIAKIPNGDLLPELRTRNWIRLKTAISEDEAYAVMNEYPHATRAKCDPESYP